MGTGESDERIYLIPYPAIPCHALHYQTLFLEYLHLHLHIAAAAPPHSSSAAAVTRITDEDARRRMAEEGGEGGGGGGGGSNRHGSQSQYVGRRHSLKV